MSARLFAILLFAAMCFVPPATSAETIDPTDLTIQLGQRFEPVIELFEKIKKDFEISNPGSHYPGFAATLTDKKVNNGVPLGVTFGTPLSIELKNGKFSLSFPPGRFCSVSFDESGEVNSLRFNPQDAYTTLADSKKLISELSALLEQAGWKKNPSSGVSEKWLAGRNKVSLYTKTQQDCQERIDQGEPDPACRLVEVQVTRLPQLKAEIQNCGEIDASLPTDSIDAPGSHTGRVAVMAAEEIPRFKPGCPNISARIGTRFGIIVNVIGERKKEIISELVTRVTHPPFEGKGISDEWESPMRTGEPRFAGWIFEHSEELVAGEWTIEIRLGTEMLARQVFYVEVAQ
ncbi:MAG: DUF3859 domain-containing protein [Deltaproteobacteria bacterium]|nr:DUF3859 domain-containing protein [Deltaproteobacteria bacterium]